MLAAVRLVAVLLVVARESLLGEAPPSRSAVKTSPLSRGNLILV